jgi:hypothetical protein
MINVQSTLILPHQVIPLSKLLGFKILKYKIIALFIFF